MGTASALGGKQGNTQREKSELTRSYMYAISLHMIYVPRGIDDIVHSLKERNRKAVIEGWDDSYHLGVDGGKSGRMREPAFPESFHESSGTEFVTSELLQPLNCLET